MKLLTSTVSVRIRAQLLAPAKIAAVRQGETLTDYLSRLLEADLALGNAVEKGPA